MARVRPRLKVFSSPVLSLTPGARAPCLHDYVFVSFLCALSPSPVVLSTVHPVVLELPPSPVPSSVTFPSYHFQ